MMEKGVIIYGDHFISRCSSVHVFLFDVHPQAWLSGVPHDLRQRYMVTTYSDKMVCDSLSLQTDTSRLLHRSLGMEEGNQPRPLT